MRLSKPLGYMMGRTRRVYKNLVVSGFKKQLIELSFEQFVMMQILNSDCPLIQQDVANQLQKDKSIIVRQINVLLELGYIIRQTNDEDKRKKYLMLTQNGLDILKQMKGIASEVTEKLLSGITQNDLDIFHQVMMRIQENGRIEE